MPLGGRQGEQRRRKEGRRIEMSREGNPCSSDRRKVPVPHPVRKNNLRWKVGVVDENSPPVRQVLFPRLYKWVYYLVLTDLRHDSHDHFISIEASEIDSFALIMASEHVALKQLLSLQPLVCLPTWRVCSPRIMIGGREVPNITLSAGLIGTQSPQRNDFLWQ